MCVFVVYKVEAVRNIIFFFLNHPHFFFFVWLLQQSFCEILWHFDKEAPVLRIAIWQKRREKKEREEKKKQQRWQWLTLISNSIFFFMDLLWPLFTRTIVLRFFFFYLSLGRVFSPFFFCLFTFWLQLDLVSFFFCFEVSFFFFPCWLERVSVRSSSFFFFSSS